MMTAIGGFDQASWHELLSKAERICGLNDGFRLIYNPWSALDTTTHIFLSLNPGVPPDGADLRNVSDERGNAYVVEERITRSPITAQFLSMADFLAVSPDDILCGTVLPFRSDDWQSLSRAQRMAGLELGQRFWGSVLARRQHRVIICTGQEPADMVVSLTGAKLEDERASGWGGISLRRFATEDGRKIIHLPHLSRFRLFSRAECAEPLTDIFERAA